MVAAIYARKSTDQSGVADDQKSVARQVDHARQYATRKGWTIADDAIFVDDGVSGAEFASRPGYMRLLNALAPRPTFSVLIVAELSRLGREQLETGYAVKQLAQADVKIVSYLEDREVLLESATDKFLMTAVNFAAEIEREKARQRTYDAMVRKARAGHVTGGRVFGYDNVDILGAGGDRSHVELRINAGEAAVVRRIFELAAVGEGLKNITKRLNAEGQTAPRSQLGRPRAWAPSSVREVLHRELYRGRRVWNKTRKRDRWGQKRQHDRPAADWLTMDAEALRVVPEALWLAVHRQIKARQESYRRWTQGDPTGAANGKGVRQHYFLTGFGRCACCGGSIQAVSRASTAGRNFRYCCSMYWNRGATVCANGRMVNMPAADRAVHDLIRAEVLRPKVLERALDRAVELLSAETRDETHREKLTRRLLALDGELANLAETAARGGAVPVILDLLSRRTEERQRLLSELAALERPAPMKLARPAALRDELRGFLAGWSALLTENVVEARPILNVALAGQRISFAPVSEGGYELTVPIAFDRVMSAAIPALSRLQDVVASPTGIEPVSRP